MKRYLKGLALCLLLAPMAFAQSHTVPTLDRNNTWTGVNGYSQSPQVPEPANAKDAVPKDYVDAHSGTNLPHASQVISGVGDGTAAAMPEKGTSVAGGVASVAWDEDVSNGRFDCRNPAYAGGCLGVTPGLAMQAFANRMICYEAVTGNHASTQFPPGTITIGTPSNPTLKLPAGAKYRGGGGYEGKATTFQATYNNVNAIEFDLNLVPTSPCSSGGTSPTDAVSGGSRGGFSEHGCNQGGCVNVPGDSGNYPLGGPLQVGIVLADGGGSEGVDGGINANNNGGDGIHCGGLTNHCFELGGVFNNGFFYFGIDQAGQNYQLGAAEFHGDVVLDGLDNILDGPFHASGTFMTPGIEYGHVAGVVWGGGNSELGFVFSEIEEIGLIRVTNSTTGTMHGGRFDGMRGAGILALGGGDTYIAPRIISACRYPGTTNYLVASVAVATPGSGQTNGTYLLTASSGAAQIQVVVAGGTVTATPLVTVHGRAYTATPPTFTLAAGGTPATFTVTMQPIFFDAGFGNAYCDYIDEHGGGLDIFISPLPANQTFFGASFATGDYYTRANASWINPNGNGPGGDPIWDKPASFLTAGGQRIVIADANINGGGPSVSGSALNLSAGSHIQMANSTPTTITSTTGGYIMQDVWIMGDGFTTLPEAASFLNSGWLNCSGHNLLLLSNQIYHYLITQNTSFGIPPTMTEQCDSINQDYWQVGFANLVTPPTVDTLAASDVIGSQAVRALPALFNGTLSITGASSSFAYCFVTMVYVAGGKQTNAPICETHTPPVTHTALDNVIYRASIPAGWSRYRLIFQSTTDPAFSALIGTMLDVSATNGHPQPAIPDTSFFVVKTTPLDSNIIPTANQSINMTGTFNFDSSHLPASSTALGIPGQVKIDPTVSTGAIYYCTTEDHWVKAPLTFATF